MTRMTRPDCAVTCNLIITHTHTHTNNTHRLLAELTYYSSRAINSGTYEPDKKQLVSISGNLAARGIVLSPKARRYPLVHIRLFIQLSPQTRNLARKPESQRLEAAVSLPEDCAAAGRGAVLLTVPD